MESLKTQLIYTETDGGKMIKTDAMGREKFWEDLGESNDGK